MNRISITPNGLKALIKEARTLLQNDLREALLKESGERGFIYEQTIAEAFELQGIEVTPSAGNNSTISDLGISIGGVDVAIEIKLSHADNLGAIRKSNFKSLEWTGESFSGAARDDSSMKDVIDGLIEKMNASSTIKKKFDDLESYITQYHGAPPWNLLSIFGSDKGGEDQRYVYAIMRNKPKDIRFNLPDGMEAGFPNKQIANPKDGIEIDQATLLNIMSGKLGPNGAPTSYVIVGKGPGGENKVAGEVYTLGKDPLGTGAPTYSPASIGVEIRFGGAGDDKSGRSFSLNFKTKATGKANEGLKFSSAQELARIFGK
jgi:hypothetical protein